MPAKRVGFIYMVGSERVVSKAQREVKFFRRKGCKVPAERVGMVYAFTVPAKKKGKVKHA